MTRTIRWFTWQFQVCGQVAASVDEFLLLFYGALGSLVMVMMAVWWRHGSAFQAFGDVEDLHFRCGAWRGREVSAEDQMQKRVLTFDKANVLA